MSIIRPGGPASTLATSAFMALGLVQVYTFVVIAPLIHPGHGAVYHWSGTPLHLFLPSFLYIASVWTIVTALLFRARHPGRARMAIWSGILLFTPAILASNWSLFATMPHPRLAPCLFDLAILAGLLLCLLRNKILVMHLDRLLAFASSVLVFFSIGAALLFAQLAWFGWKARSLNHSPALHQQASISAATGNRQAKTGPRIIWIVFDELSYLQVYERRYPGLDLPAFDALAAQSTLFTHAVPAGIFTDRVLPSLLSGSPVDLVRATPSGLLLTHDPLTRRWQTFDQHRTIFQDALDAGYRTAVAGWYIPYCRILPAVLDRCLWSYHERIKSGLMPQAPLAENLAQPFVDALRAATSVIAAGLFLKIPLDPGPAIRETDAHIEDYLELTQAADRLLLDPSLGFVLLHLPIPHFGGIYNRRTGQLTTGPSTYLDNLALADKTLAHLRSVLEQTGQWDASVVVVMGDHSWRTSLTQPDPALWKTEEQKASHGGAFDDRPAYIVKLAGQHTPTPIAVPFPAQQTRALFGRIMTGNIRSPEDLADWANAVRP
jgi:hypothetical protein